MLERLKRWWRRRLCFLVGHDEEELWRDTFPLLPPESEPKPVELPNTALAPLITIREHGFDSCELSETRCRRCGERSQHSRLTRVRPGVSRTYYIELPPDRYEADEHGNLWRKGA